MNRLLRWFDFGHLPAELQAVSQPFGVLAHDIDQQLVESAEKTAALRKLLEAKDCAVRAAIEGGTL